MDDSCFACFSGMCMDHEGGYDEPERPAGCLPSCLIEQRLYENMATVRIHHKPGCPQYEQDNNGGEI
jgi:hypothetical protein